MNDRYVILDVRGLLIRAHSRAEKIVPDGEKMIATAQAGAATFLEQELRPILDEGVQPREIIAVWDAGNNYRMNLFPSYKEKRMQRNKLASDESKNISQRLKSYAKEMFKAFGIKQVQVLGEEADDVIAMLCQRLDSDNIIVVTVDEDLLQLLNERVSVKQGHRLYDWRIDKDARTKKGTKISHLALYKSIVGDSSDEYSGVPGLGPKAWETFEKDFGAAGLDWLNQCVQNNAVNALHAWAGQANNKFLTTLANNFSQWKLCYRLATLNPDICFGAEFGKLRRPEWTVRIPDRFRLTSLLFEIGADFMLDYYEKYMPTQELVDVTKYEYLQSLAQEILNSPVVSWDYESSDKNQFECYKEASTKEYVDVLSQEIAGISINFGQNMEKTIYVPFDHVDTHNYPLDWCKWIIGFLNQRPTVVQNASFELTLTLKQLNMWANAPYDTAIMASYVDENEENNLKAMSLHYLNYKQASYKETTQGRSMYELSGEEVLSYGCDDSLVTSHLFDLFKVILQTEGTWDFYRTYEVQPVIDDVFSFVAGTDLDTDLLEEQKKEEEEKIESEMARLRQLLEENTIKYSQEQVTAAATNLFNEWWAVEETKILGQDDEEEKLTSARERIWLKCWNACFYQPYEEKELVDEFSPTASVLTKIARKFDPEVPKLTKTTKAGVEEWEIEVTDYMGEKKGENYDLLAHFVTLLYSARANLTKAKRHGPEYEALKEFCVEHGAVKKRLAKAGDELNIGSFLQMQELLYAKLRLPVRRRSKVDKGSFRDSHGLPGSPATGLKAIAAALVYDVPEGDWRVGALDAYRTVALGRQNLSLYYSKYPLWVSPEDGKLHPQIKNCGTVTRRPSGSSPNVLQVSGKDDAKIRKLFPAGDYGDGNRVYVSIDFASQELLILACESKDPKMLEAFTSSPRLDLHAMTGAGISSILLPRLGGPASGLEYAEFIQHLHSPESDLHGLTNTIRKKYAKGVNFGISYGMGPNTLAENLLIDIELAKEIFNSTMELYYRIPLWQKEVAKFAREHGYSVTAYGNRRHATNELFSDDDAVVSRMERQLANAVIQSTAADVLKITRQEMRQRGMVAKYGLRAIKPIYDEITVSVPVEKAKQYINEMVEVMRIQPPGYPVALDVDVSLGTTWGDQVELNDLSDNAIESVIREIKDGC